jgi:MarR family transcriptional regulator for hemolysin
MPTTFDNDLLFLLYDVARHMRTHADQRARRQGMTRAQWIILLRLERQPNLSQNELAAIAEVEPITVARLIDRLEARGLVKRRADPKDRRIWRLVLTPAAAPVLRKIKKYRADFNDQLTAGVDRATLRTMVGGLLQMKTNLSDCEIASQASG